MDDKLRRAQALATEAHQGQRYGDAPYTVHLAAVVAVMERFGIVDVDVLAAGWLHDTIEDTPVSRAEVAAAVGERAASMVDAVSDGPGENRKARKARPYRLIPQTPGAVLVKLADRIANVESASKARPGLLEMYRREHPAFRQKLQQDGEADAMWAHLDALLRL